jgi:hypothetical protein
MAGAEPRGDAVVLGLGAVALGDALGAAGLDHSREAFDGGKRFLWHAAIVPEIAARAVALQSLQILYHLKL